MKKIRNPSDPGSVPDDLRPEYQFNYREARPNRFAGRASVTPIVVTLDPDVSEVFRTAESVNNVLRALIGSMPKMS